MQYPMCLETSERLPYEEYQEAERQLKKSDWDQSEEEVEESGDAESIPSSDCLEDDDEESVDAVAVPSSDCLGNDVEGSDCLEDDDEESVDAVAVPSSDCLGNDVEGSNCLEDDIEELVDAVAVPSSDCLEDDDEESVDAVAIPSSDCLEDDVDIKSYTANIQNDDIKLREQAVIASDEKYMECKPRTPNEKSSPNATSLPTPKSIPRKSLQQTLDSLWGGMSKDQYLRKISRQLIHTTPTKRQKLNSSLSKKLKYCTSVEKNTIGYLLDAEKRKSLNPGDHLILKDIRIASCDFHWYTACGVCNKSASTCDKEEHKTPLGRRKRFNPKVLLVDKNDHEVYVTVWDPEFKQMLVNWINSEDLDHLKDSVHFADLLQSKFTRSFSCSVRFKGKDKPCFPFWNFVRVIE